MMFRLNLWTILGTMTNELGVVDFLDPEALTNPLRFYRAQRAGPYQACSSVIHFLLSRNFDSDIITSCTA